MVITRKQLTSILEGTEVNPLSTEADVRALVEMANKYRFKGIAAAQCYQGFAKRLLDEAGNTDTIIVGGAGWPTGMDSTTVKLIQIRDSIALGCREMDITNNIGWIKSGKYSQAENELKMLVDVCDGIPAKIIIEVTKLTEDETKRVCEAVLKSGAAFVKTGTGTSDLPTTLGHIKLIKACVGDVAGIKASGGIRKLKTVEEMIKLGVSRFGIGRKWIQPLLDECVN
ncbi:MAG: deoxyribose-phosphate aldolase [Eubacteriales bacterium]|nr:deoxyribose-phosphate aldolase [Eubacteriales bacterium]